MDSVNGLNTRRRNVSLRVQGGTETVIKEWRPASTVSVRVVMWSGFNNTTACAFATM